MNECINCKYQCEDNDGYGVDFICHKDGKRKRVQPDDTCKDFHPNCGADMRGENEDL